MKKYYLTKEQLSLPDELQHRQILLLWTTEAEQRLWAQEPPVPVSAKARTQLSRLLFQRLLYLADSVMKALPQERMIARNPLLQWDMRLATQAEKAQTSKELLTEWEETRGESLFLKVPLLRNMLDECVCRFTEFVGEIFLRVACHRDEITKLLFDGADFGSIVHMHCANTDLHFHGRSTMMIETEGGSFFYKPRDCRIDILFGGLVEKWFSGLTHVPRTIVGEGYGICETIVATPVHSMEEIEQYFENMGGLFAIAQALGSSDLHSENLIAHGTFPVVVDLETILTPFTKVFNDPTIYPNVPSGEVTFTDDLNASLYASALLPNLRFNDESSVLLDEKQSNLPVLYGVKHSVRGHEQALFKGFSDTYDLCISLREELLQELELFREIPIRRVIRNTDYYAKIQKRLMAPSALQSTATQKAITQNLGNYFLRHGATHLLGIADWEELCLLEGDIPYFYVTGEWTSLLSYNGEIAGDFFHKALCETHKNVFAIYPPKKNTSNLPF